MFHVLQCLRLSGYSDGQAWMVIADTEQNGLKTNQQLSHIRRGINPFKCLAGSEKMRQARQVIDTRIKADYC